MSTQDWSRMVHKKGSKGDSNASTVSIADIVRHFGGEVREGRNVSVHCCMHDDARKSAVIDTYNNLYFCHTCGKGGNAINLIMELENVGFKDALARANEIIGSGSSSLRTGNKPRSPAIPRRTWNI